MRCAEGIVCCSWNIWLRWGTPKQPSDLAQHNGLLYQLHDMLQDEWVFHDGNQDHKVKLSESCIERCFSTFVRRWCIAGKVVTKSCLDMFSYMLW
ncbi:hypothetical protein O9929_24825 [Vibrio lentus]|nr:hypothetical protein [Vibrio lentus]